MFDYATFIAAFHVIYFSYHISIISFVFKTLTNFSYGKLPLYILVLSLFFTFFHLLVKYPIYIFITFESKMQTVF